MCRDETFLPCDEAAALAFFASTVAVRVDVEAASVWGTEGAAAGLGLGYSSALGWSSRYGSDEEHREDKQDAGRGPQGSQFGEWRHGLWVSHCGPYNIISTISEGWRS